MCGHARRMLPVGHACMCTGRHTREPVRRYTCAEHCLYEHAPLRPYTAPLLYCRFTLCAPILKQNQKKKPSADKSSRLGCSEKPAKYERPGGWASGAVGLSYFMVSSTSVRACRTASNTSPKAQEHRNTQTSTHPGTRAYLRHGASSEALNGPLL